MSTKQILSLLLTSSTLFFSTGCESSKVLGLDLDIGMPTDWDLGIDFEFPENDSFTYCGVYFGRNFPDNFKKGIKDGCVTSKGNYRKSHQLFNSDKDYSDGWFLGRKRCRHLLVPEE